MNSYLLFKSLHLVAVISWMAGLLYLPRIFVYHSEKKNNKNISDVFKTMERKLFYFIMMPSMIFTWIFGLLLLHSVGFSVVFDLWMLLKLCFVLFLTLYNFYLGRCVKLFSINQNVNSSKFYRIINEVPTILLILIVFVVIFKPL